MIKTNIIILLKVNHITKSLTHVQAKEVHIDRAYEMLSNSKI